MEESEAIARLEEAGLVFRFDDGENPSVQYDWFEGIKPGSFWHDYIIAKPVSVPGNHRPGYLHRVERMGIETDAPIARIYTIYPNPLTWYFSVNHGLMGGKHPGDFQRKYKGVDKAVQAVLEYYFGNPLLMNPRHVLQWEEERRIWRDAHKKVVAEFITGWDFERDCRKLHLRDRFSLLYLHLVLKRHANSRIFWPIHRLVYLLKWRGYTEEEIASECQRRHFYEPEVYLEQREVDGIIQTFICWRRTVPKSGEEQEEDGS